MENQIDTEENLNEDERIVSETSSNKTKTWIFRVACILLFAAGIIFFIFFLNHDSILLKYREIIILSAFAAILAIIWCFFTIRAKAVKFVVLMVSAIFLAINWFIYFRYIPKYWPNDACAVVQADPKYASAIVEPLTETKLGMKTMQYYMVIDNPFFELGYLLNVISDGKVTTWIAFDPATGLYYVFRELDD